MILILSCNECREVQKLSKLLLRTGLSVATVIALSLASAPAAIASPVEPTVNTSLAYVDSAAGLTQLLEDVLAIPDSVLTSGDEATRAWFAQHPSSSTAVSLYSRANVLGCVGSISVALAGVAFPAAKLLKIKKLADQLGGVKKAVDLLWGASFNYEKVQAAGGALAALGAELIGITAIKENCFT